MARLISERVVASVRLLTVEMSEDELTVYIPCLNYLLEHCDENTVEHICGAFRDEVEGMRDSLAQLLGSSNSGTLPIRD